MWTNFSFELNIIYQKKSENFFLEVSENVWTTVKTRERLEGANTAGVAIFSNKQY